jgi:hypothetical protein
MPGQKTHSSKPRLSKAFFRIRDSVNRVLFEKGISEKFKFKGPDERILLLYVYADH